jgi:hypothetical protein
MTKQIAGLFLLLVLNACTNTTKNIAEAQLVAIQSPAADSCAEPYLFTDAKGIVHLSWVQKKGKDASLHFANGLHRSQSVQATIGL